MIKYFSEILAEYIIKTNSTYRETGKHFDISRHVVYRQIKKLKKINPDLYHILKLVHELNWYRRSIRGGQTTKEKIKKEVEKEQAPHRNKEVLNKLYEKLGTWEKVAEELGVSFRTVMRYK